MMTSNFLLLDEPTNHLDMRAKDVLLKALEGYSGTVVFVSHDRYFIDKLATRVFEVSGGAIHLFPGNYEDYLFRKAAATAAAPVPTEHASKPVSAVPARSAPNHSAPNPANAASANVSRTPDNQSDKQRRLNPIKLRQMKERQRAIEDEVTRLEVEIADFEQALSAYHTAQQSIDLAGILESRREDMKNLLAEWEEVSGTIEANR
jgi:ATP-binding cassette subfamily F protein 3